MNGLPKNAVDDIDIEYHSYDFNLNEEINEKINEKITMSNNINKKNDNICECIYKYKLNIFGNRDKIKYNK